MNTSIVPSHSPQLTPRYLLFAIAIACLMNLVTELQDTHAAISTAGDVNPVYNNDDPWQLGSAGLYVGQSGDGSLTINNSSMVSDSAGYIGYFPGVNGTVDVIGAGSVWDNSSGVYIGWHGVGTLNIEDGGAVNLADAYIGRFDDANGSVTVTGGGSALNSSGIIYVGQSGTGSLHIDNAGVVNSVTGYINYNSTVSVLGNDSAWHMTDELFVGRWDNNASLEVQDGAVVSNTDGHVGYEGSGTAVIGGPGSMWINSGSLGIGGMHSGSLNIRNGATVISASGSIGSWSHGTVIVSGADSIWENSGSLLIGYRGYGTLTIEQNATVNNAADTWIDQYAEGTGTLQLDQGTLHTGGLIASFSDINGTGSINTSGLVSDIDLLIDESADLQQQYLLNSQPGETVTINLDLNHPQHPGSLGAGYKAQGSLTITNSMQVSSAHGYLGYRPGSTGIASVTGTGSAWNITEDNYIAYWGSSQLTISQGGVVNSMDSIVAYHPDAAGDVVVSGPGSRWNHSGQLIVGQHGTGTLLIELGATVQSNRTTIADYAGNGTTTVTDPGSTLNSLTDLYVSDDGHGILNILNAGRVINTTGYIGNSTYDNGMAKVSGPGSTWQNNGDFFVGHNGRGELNIDNGGLVENQTAYLGYDNEGNGTVTVSGNDSRWNNSGNLHVGYYGYGVLRIEQGAAVQSSTSDIGFGYNYHPQLGEGEVTITGAGSAWNNTGRLTIGVSGGGWVSVRDGGSLYNTLGRIGSGSTGSGEVLISGTGSQWVNSDGLIVGVAGMGSVEVQAGAQALNTYAYIAKDRGSQGSVTVTGAGSFWLCSSELYVGNFGAGSLLIEDGAQVISNGSYIGYYGVGGSVNVAGPGSQWHNTGTVHLGFGGNGTLNINDDAVVSIDGDILIAEYHFGSGTINLTGGTLDLNGHSIIQGNGTAEFLFTAGTLKNADAIDLTGTFNQSGGTLAPGGSIGQTTILGDYQLNAGTLELELGGIDNPHDLLSVTGNINIADLGTSLDLQAIGLMHAGTYTLIQTTAGTITGSFETISGLGQHPGLIDVQYHPQAVTITLTQDVVPEPAMFCILLVGAAPACVKRRVA